MTTQKVLFLLVCVTALVAATLACGGSQPKEEAEEPASVTTEEPVEPAATEEPAQETSVEPATKEAPQAPAEDESEFPLPEDVQNLMQLGEDTINFQTGLSLEQVAEFYRQALGAQGLSEREIVTVVSEDVVNLVFDGAPNGKSIVVQAFPMDDLTNVNVRYEDV